MVKTKNMKQYTKNGEIKTRNKIVLRVTKIVEDELGNHVEKVFQVLNPSHEMLIENGWEEYIQPNEEAVARQRDIIHLKRQLANSDYKVIKCMEATLCGEELPYDIDALHEERNRIRAQVNELESNIEQHETE